MEVYYCYGCGSLVGADFGTVGGDPKKRLCMSCYMSIPKVLNVACRYGDVMTFDLCNGSVVEGAVKDIRGRWVHVGDWYISLDHVALMLVGRHADKANGGDADEVE